MGKSAQTTPEQSVVRKSFTTSSRRLGLSVSKKYSLVNRIPPELLELIFNRAIPPHALLDPAFFSGGRSPWCHSLRLMKSIVLVCRSWYNVGSAFLYQHICIRGFPQLECLRKTLHTSNSSPRNLGALVKSLDIQCYIPESFAPQFAENLCAIMKLCPFISTFGYTSPCTLPPSALPTSCLKSQVTHLQLRHTVHYIDLVSILHDLQDQLLVLHVEISHKEIAQRLISPESKTRLIFPSLLALSFSPFDWKSTHALYALKADWSMPSLQRLTMVSGYPPPGSDSIARYQAAIIDFLSTHGRRLLYLRIEICFGPRFLKVLEHCPLLERLVMHPATFERMNWIPDNQVLHTKLRFLDLTYSFNARLSYVDSKLWISKEVLPSLQLVRHFCDIPSYLSTWVDSFEPCSEVGSNDFTIQIFQHQVIYKGGVLLFTYCRALGFTLELRFPP